MPTVNIEGVPTEVGLGPESVTEEKIAKEAVTEVKLAATPWEKLIILSGAAGPEAEARIFCESTVEFRGTIQVSGETEEEFENGKLAELPESIGEHWGVGEPNRWFMCASGEEPIVAEPLQVTNALVISCSSERKAADGPFYLDGLRFTIEYKP